MYFVTTLRVLDGVIDDCRTVGFYKHYINAFEICEHNICDIFEDGYYQFAVITFVEEGLYPSQSEQQWFKWEDNKPKEILEYHKRPDPIGDYQIYIVG